ncbi:MAG: 30S ribosomal protein S6 [Termitinemataceae bacterium]|jgi:small subunit ribosomal protein S6|nr:MAG: 30S ribosomal protein S6 [Termitinemataceae bacterium]
MCHYEMMVILPVEEELQKTGREQLQSDLAAHNVEVENVTEIGDRELAYEIGKHRRGKYVLFNLKLDGSVIAALGKAFKLNENLIRHLFVKTG